MVSGHLGRLRAQAAGHHPVPYLLDTGDRVIAVPPVDEARLHLLLAMPDQASLRTVVTAVCGPAAPEVVDAVASDDMLVLQLVLDDIRSHFAVREAARVGHLLDRYGDHLQADLRAHYDGVDVLDLWRGRLTVDELANLIDHLPRTSAYQDALAHDEEMASTITGQPPEPKPPRLTEFGPDIEILAAIHDRLGELGNAVIAAGGGTPRTLRPWVRPVTAFDRIRAERRRAGAEDLLRQLVPDRFPHP